MMNSYNLNVKEDEYTVELKFKGVKYFQRFKRTDNHMFKRIEGDDFEDIEEIPDKLWEELESCIGFNIAQAFQEVKNELSN